MQCERTDATPWTNKSWHETSWPASTLTQCMKLHKWRSNSGNVRARTVRKCRDSNMQMSSWFVKSVTESESWDATTWWSLETIQTYCLGGNIGRALSFGWRDWGSNPGNDIVFYEEENGRRIWLSGEVVRAWCLHGLEVECWAASSERQGSNPVRDIPFSMMDIRWWSKTR